MKDVYVLLDADNIQLEIFIKDILPQIEYKYGKILNLSIFCQTNIIIKYISNKSMSFCLKCSKTKNKNASDAQILFEAGKIYIENDANTIIIVSNDKIFNEIVDNERIFLYENNINKKNLKLNKQNIINIYNQLKIEYGNNASTDVFIDDLICYFNKPSITTLKEFIINNIPELSVSKSNCVYYSKTR